MAAKKKLKKWKVSSVKRYAVIAFVLIFAAIGAKELFFSFAATSSEQIITTLYAYPTLASWQQVESAAPTVKYAIVNICAPDGTGSGCGSPADETNSDWVPTIKALQKAGITPLYYISTNYGNEPLATVESELANAKTWYGITDPMFDTTATNNPSYYNSLYTYAVNNGADAVVFNPGTVVPQTYMFGSKAILQVYEGTAQGFASTSFPSWMSSYNPDQFAATLSVGTASTIGTDVNDAVKDHIGNFYEDDEPESPNYATLPSFWSTEVGDVSAAAGGSSSSPTPSPSLSPSPSPSPTPSPSGGSGSSSTTPNSPAPTTTSTGGSTTPSISVPPLIKATSPSTITFGGTGATATTPVDVSVNGVKVSSNGQLNTKELTNGKHTVTISQNGKATTQTITVYNKLNPFDTVRNYMFAGFVGHPTVMNSGTILILLIPFLIVFYFLRDPIVSRIRMCLAKVQARSGRIR